MPGPWAGGPPPFVLFAGGSMFLLFLLFCVATFLLVRRGTFGAPPWLAGQRAPEAAQAPEAEAKKILSDRFAQGEIGPEEFMERASVLNWTPGAEQWAEPAKRR